MVNAGNPPAIDALQLTPDERALFFSEEGRIVLPSQTVIMREGDPGDEMFVVLEGELVISRLGKQIDRLGPGMILGEMAMVDDQPRSATATTATPCSLIRLDRNGFRDLVGRSPEFALRVMNIMSVRTRRLIEEEVQRQRMEEELAIGRRIQLSLLPSACPLVPGYEFAAGYRAAREVGGDLYDFIIQPDKPNLAHIVIADVTGKGVPAALYMAVSRTLLHTYALDGNPPSQALARVNQFIREDKTSPLFLSAFYAVLDTNIHCLTYANAGHNAPIWLQPSTGDMEYLNARGIVLGAFDAFIPEERLCFLQPGDYVIFYTDGITEARNPQGDFFDEEGLEAVVAAREWDSANELLTAIITAVEEFSAGAPQADDYTVIVLRRKPLP
ncbi:MAG TPA: SpoIIE family protein phosphatase [Promineifilum sp.]|nr:SpoIIE family protein phosphatase [Promineifilum sp.]HRO91381.1 SpoIIE family protein phosphatase [Promineifilum sp.]HRQ14329.1 SpoIIE family protein phosphatase [Promineifilum sp.]